MVGVEHVARGLDVEPLVGALAPRQRQQPVEVGADRGRLGVVAAGRGEPVDLALGLLAGLLGELGLGDAGAVALDLVLVVDVAQLLADGVELAPQQELALRLLHALGDVVADAAAELDLAQRLAGPGEGLLEPLLDVDGLEQLELALVGQVGGVAGGVGEGARLVDRAQERGHAGVAARLEDLLDDGAVLVRQLVRALADLLGVGVLGDLDAERLAGRVGAAELGAVQRADGDAPGAAGEHRGVAVELGDDADPGEAALAARDQHDVRGPVGRQGVVHGGPCLVGGQRHRKSHVRENDRVIQWDQRKRSGSVGHSVSLSSPRRVLPAAT